MKALAACAVLIACGGASSPDTRGPLLSDDVTVSEVIDPKVGSGILMIFAKVTGLAAPEQEKRDYFILYMGPGQTLPAVGTKCSIDFRHGRLGEWVDSNLRPLLGRTVERFACSDGRHWPDGSPPAR
jgi:hypothetical protein